jgi:Mce-associated membrane protein
MADDAAAPGGKPSDEPSSATATAATSDDVGDTGVADSGVGDSGEGDEPDAEEAEAQADDSHARTKAPMSHVRLATTLGLAAVVALAALCGWLGFRAYQSHQAAEERNLYLQVGRQAALNLTTIDFEHADEDVQRVLDSSTGTFYDDFQARAQPFKEVVKQAKSKSVGTIAEAGVETVNEDGAEVLVAVTVRTSNAGAAEQEPRAWRMRITVQKVGDDAKVANVRFVS